MSVDNGSDSVIATVASNIRARHPSSITFDQGSPSSQRLPLWTGHPRRLTLTGPSLRPDPSARSHDKYRCAALHRDKEKESYP